MAQTKEAVYLINDDKYLHLRENGAGVGLATYNKVTGEPLESGQISEKNLSLIHISVKDAIAPTALAFKNSRTFQMGGKMCIRDSYFPFLWCFNS